jgi:hypothetical protein
VSVLVKALNRWENGEMRRREDGAMGAWEYGRWIDGIREDGKKEYSRKGRRKDGKTLV